MVCRKACVSAEMLRFEAPGTVARFDSLPLHYMLIGFFHVLRTPSEAVIFVIISFILEFF